MFFMRTRCTVMYRESRESKKDGDEKVYGGVIFRFLELERGEFLLGLSDGMGVREHGM